MARKLIAFHDEDRRAMEDLAEDRSATFQELMDEAVRDLLKKHGRYTDLKSALRASAEKPLQRKQRKGPAAGRRG